MFVLYVQKYKIMINTSNINIADNFFGMIKNQSIETRLDLISRISESLKNPSKHIDSSNSWKLLFGSFDSKQSAEEMITDIRNVRNTNKKIEDL